MMKKRKCVLAMALVLSMVVNVSMAQAVSVTETTKGKLGKTTVTALIDRRGSSSTYSQAYLKISAEHVVEKLGIRYINIVKKDGGGVMGAKTSKTNAKTASYTGQQYAPNSISSISADFYVESTNFGNFTHKLAY